MISAGWWLFGEILSAGGAFIWGLVSRRRGYLAGYRDGSRIGQAAGEVLGQVRAALRPTETHGDDVSTPRD